MKIIRKIKKALVGGTVFSSMMYLLLTRVVAFDGHMVKTSDTTNIVPIIIMVVGSGLALIILIIIKRKKKDM